MAMDEAEQKLFNDTKAAKEAAEAAIKTMVKADEHQKVQAELDALKAEKAATVKATEDAAKVKAESDKVAKEKLLLDRQTELVKKGLPEDKVRTLTEEGLTIAELALSVRKPGADFGGNSGASALTGTPYDLAKLAYSK